MTLYKSLAEAKAAHPKLADAIDRLHEVVKAAAAKSPAHGCSGCGGGNAVRDVAMARTPDELERALEEA